VGTVLWRWWQIAITLTDLHVAALTLTRFVVLILGLCLFSLSTSTAELTHDVPAGPEILNPPVLAEGCIEVDAEAPLIIEWDPVESDIWGDTEIEIEAYQVIVQSETEDGPEVAFSATLPPSEDEMNMVTVPPEALFHGVEYAFEILAIEESGNQTITESCFETSE